ncbi:unnamed protein product [Sphagnum compactum]
MSVQEFTTSVREFELFLQITASATVDPDPSQTFNFISSAAAAGAAPPIPDEDNFQDAWSPMDEDRTSLEVAIATTLFAGAARDVCVCSCAIYCLSVSTLELTRAVEGTVFHRKFDIITVVDARTTKRLRETRERR